MGFFKPLNLFIADSFPVRSQSVITSHVGVHQRTAPSREPQTYAPETQTGHRLRHLLLDHARVSHAQPGAY